MPALIDLRRRIRSVKSTQQITRAMKMVSAAKLRRAQEAIYAARPYARKMREVLNSIAPRTTSELHPLLERRDGGRVLLVVVSADKGLCGGFNANIIRTALEFVRKRGAERVQLCVVGRKARDILRRRDVTILADFVSVLQPLRYETAVRLARLVIGEYEAERIDEVHVVYNEFKSIIQQQLIVEELLPIPVGTVNPAEPSVEHLYEPTPAEIFKLLLPKHVEIQLWRALLESAAAEQGARMTAMDAATNNAADVIANLTLYMNKVRQAAITKEIIEVVSGAGAPR